jgi:hypothetical protein
MLTESGLFFLPRPHPRPATLRLAMRARATRSVARSTEGKKTKKVFTEGNNVNEGLQILATSLVEPDTVQAFVAFVVFCKKDQLSRISKRREHAFDIPSIEPFVETF